MSELLSIYRHALTARLVDERLDVLARGERIALHPGSQRAEVAIVAATAALGESDWVFPTARDHAASLARGVEVGSYLAHVIGGASDPLVGHATPGAFCSREKKIAPPTGQLSQHLTQAMGIAWAMRLRKDPSCVLTFLPETAAEAGDFHSAVNFAGATKAPIVFVVRTDGSEAPAPAVEIVDKGIAYGVTAVEVSGEPLAVLAATREAVARARGGEGPTLLEVRLAGEEGKDPLEALRQRLIADGALDESSDMHHRRERMGEIEAAIVAAIDAGAPALETIFEHVTAEPGPHLIRQRDELRSVYEAS
ncbi:MAG: thiamine pyrophosphate-dependent enzyme [Sandaracinus sp.]